MHRLIFFFFPGENFPARKRSEKTGSHFEGGSTRGHCCNVLSTEPGSCSASLPTGANCLQFSEHSSLLLSLLQWRSLSPKTFIAFKQAKTFPGNPSRGRVFCQPPGHAVGHRSFPSGLRPEASARPARVSPPQPPRGSHPWRGHRRGAVLAVTEGQLGEDGEFGEVSGVLLRGERRARPRSDNLLVVSPLQRRHRLRTTPSRRGLDAKLHHQPAAFSRNTGRSPGSPEQSLSRPHVGALCDAVGTHMEQQCGNLGFSASCFGG